jgi:HTH-type transcriptional regulator/antitoxin HigA
MKIHVSKDWLHGIGEEEHSPLAGPLPDPAEFLCRSALEVSMADRLSGYARELLRRAWIEDTDADDPESLRDQITLLLHRFPQTSPALLRGSLRQNVSDRALDPRLTAWLALLNTRSLEVDSEVKYEGIPVKEIRTIAKFSRDPKGPQRAVEFIRSMGVIVFVIKTIPGTGVDGCAFWSLANRPVIGLSVRHDRLDNFWFSLLHECAHVALHVRGPQDTFVDDLEGQVSKDEQEIEANLVAADAAIPRLAWKRSQAMRFPSAYNIETLAAEVGVHPSIVAGRIQHESKNFSLFREFLGQGEVSKAFDLPS